MEYRRRPGPIQPCRGSGCFCISGGLLDCLVEQDPGIGLTGLVGLEGHVRRVGQEQGRSSFWSSFSIVQPPPMLGEALTWQAVIGVVWSQGHPRSMNGLRRSPWSQWGRP